MIYLDNAATSWPKPEEVYKVVEEALRMGGNSGRGVNSTSLSASRVLYQARRNLAEFFNIPKPERIVFTQNVTEALNLILKGFLAPEDHVLISAVEHNAVVRPLEALKEKGVTYSVVPCDKTGTLDLEALEKLISPHTKLICVTHASNVFGTILPVKQIGEIAGKHKIHLLVDAAQSAGVLPIDVEDFGIDFLAFTGHKGLLGPQGTGGVYIGGDLKVSPLLHGGTGNHSASILQPSVLPEGLESGTRNLPGIAGLSAGVKYCQEHREEIRAHELNLMAKVLSYFQKEPRISFLGPKDLESRVGLVSFNIEGFSADQVGILLDRNFGIVTRTGLHCSPFAHSLAGTLEIGAIRLSVGPFTKDEEIEIFLQAITSILGG